MRRTALVVEDDLAIRHLVRAALTGHGYEVVEAGDGGSALTAASASPPDVILLDIGLPDMDGLSVLKEVKTDPDLRGIPVLMVTAWADPDMVRVAMDRGAADYVCKPFAVDDLLARVDASAGSLPTRDHLAEVLERELRSRRPFAVVLVEVEQPVADEALQAVARRFRHRAGVFDSIVQYGERSLVVVLPGADVDRAQARAQTLREALSEAPVSTLDETLRISAGFGVAVWDDGDSAEALLSRAASALSA
jgi:PleD family two-component response regulator